MLTQIRARISCLRDRSMLSPALHRQVFGDVCDKLDREAVQKSVQHLKEQKLWGHTTTSLPEVDFELPPLLGSDLDEHFAELGRRYSKDYRLAAEVLSSNPLAATAAALELRPGMDQVHERRQGGRRSRLPRRNVASLRCRSVHEGGTLSDARDCRVGRLLVLLV
ncbi:hypothetical protein MRX96_007932 [Rhipicephalus microplus]